MRYFSKAMLVASAAFCLNLSAYSQNISLKISNVTVKEAMERVKKDTGYSFVFSSKDINTNQRVSVSVGNATIEEVVDQILRGQQDLDYEIQGKKIVLRKIQSSIKKQGQINGRILDNNGEPIIGATVLEKGTTNGTVSDFDGNFSINVTSNSELEVSYVGYQSQIVKAVFGKSLLIKLKENLELLDEVVVVGYGVSRKSDVTGSTLRIGGDEITARPVSNALESMQGKVAGVDISSQQRPGEVPSINIRGVRSLLASNSPLYVVDGIPLMTGGIENINPQDIESIDVLKDASATAIYGSRGANGVVIVTTKKGHSGKFTVNYSGSITLETLENKSELTNAAEYIDYRRWAYYYSDPDKYPRGDQPTQENDYIIFHGSSDPSAWQNIMRGWSGTTWDGSKVNTTDWVDMVTRTGITQEHTLGISGGTDKIKGYYSFGYLKNRGTQIGQEYERYTNKVNLEMTPTSWFTVGGLINATYSIQEYGQSKSGKTTSISQNSIYESARANLPYAVPYDENGERIVYPGADDNIRTVVDEWKYSQDQRLSFRAFGSIYAQIDFGKLFTPLEGLKYRLNFGPDFSTSRNGIYLDKNSVIRTGSSHAYLGKSQVFSYTLDNLIYYDRTFGKHTVGLTLLQSATAYDKENSAMSADNIPFSSQKWNALTNSDVTALRSWSSGISEKQLMSYMFRANYNYNQRYLLTVSGRWDGASQLAEGNKWAFFPSVALAWRLEQEDFIKNQNWIDQLKLRLGYGSTGNSAIDPYATKGGITSLFYPFNTMITSGSIPSSSMANKKLGWEKTTQFNLGIDFSFWNNRLSGVIDVYTSRTTDLLMKMTIPTVSGYSSTFANVGETSNRGVDFTLNTVNVDLKDFQWNTSLNISWQKDKIEKLATGSDDINNNWFIGEQIGVIYGYQAIGIWQKGEEAEMAKFNANGNKFEVGQIKILDQPDENGKTDDKIDAINDRVIIGNTRPNWVFGMTNNWTYKNFDLSIFLYGRFGYKYNTGGEMLDGRYNVRKVDYYTENNVNSEYQRPEFTMGTGDPYYQALGYKDGSFLKIRNIALGYTFPNKILNSMKINSFRIYAQVINPGTIFSKIDFMDMDTQSASYNRGLTFGINLGF